jgi:hypothetical protein
MMVTEHRNTLEALNERSKSRFTRSDGEEIVAFIESLRSEITQLRLKVHGLELEKGQQRELALLCIQLADMRNQLPADSSNYTVPGSVSNRLMRSSSGDRFHLRRHRCAESDYAQDSGYNDLTAACHCVPTFSMAAFQ